jgi:hypothetical protein
MEAVEAFLERESLAYEDTDFGFYAWSAAYHLPQSEIPAFAKLLERVLGCATETRWKALELEAAAFGAEELYRVACRKLFVAAKLLPPERRFVRRLAHLNKWLETRLPRS